MLNLGVKKRWWDSSTIGCTPQKSPQIQLPRKRDLQKALQEGITGQRLCGCGTMRRRHRRPSKGSQKNLRA